MDRDRDRDRGRKGGREKVGAPICWSRGGRSTSGPKDRKGTRIQGARVGWCRVYQC